MTPIATRNREPVPADSPLARAVVISLFTWRRAGESDVVDGLERMGWWGDAFPSVPNDKIGSRLWLLQREKLTPQTLLRAESYATEALEWLREDGHASAVSVKARRVGLDCLGLFVSVTEAGGVDWTFDFENLWGVSHANGRA